MCLKSFPYFSLLPFCKYHIHVEQFIHKIANNFFFFDITFISKKIYNIYMYIYTHTHTHTHIYGVREYLQ